MNRNLLCVMTAAGAMLMSAVPAWAATDPASLLSSNGCTACHAVDQKIVGPAFAWVAFHYKGKADAEETVANFIINGGTGYWQPWTGAIPMPSHPNITKDQARSIAKWVLEQTPVQPPNP